MKYTIKHFRESFPATHNTSFLVRHFYRPLSFACASVLANMGISANTVSYAAAVVAVFSSGLFLINNYAAHIIGAIMVNVWLLMDCVDGNLARGVCKQPFGEFADALSSYLLVGLICTTMGVAVYFEGGVLIPAGMPWIIVMGALASSSDSLMRLVYQKYRNEERNMTFQGILRPTTDAQKEIGWATRIKVIVNFEFGIGGIIPLFILIAAIFHALDLSVIYCFFYYSGSFVFVVFGYVKTAIKQEREMARIH